MIREPGPSLEQSAKWISAFRDQTVVVKLGGELLLNPGTVDRLTRQIAILRQCGLRPVVVHGAGKQVDAACEKAGVPIEKVNGRRITNEATRDIVVDVLAGLNQTLVEKLQHHGVPALGMNGLKENWPVQCTKRPPVPQADGTTVDFGYVGDVSNVKVPDENMTIVLPSLAWNPELGFLNINADTLATSFALGTRAVKLVFLTGVSGVMRHLDDAGPISTMSADETRQILATPAIQGGMRAKLEECLRALDGGVEKVHIISGKEPHTLLREVFTDEGCGTLISS